MERGAFVGKSTPPKKDSKGKDLLGRRVPSGLTGDGKAWVTGPEGVKVRERQSWTHRTSKPHLHVFGLFLHSSEEALKGFMLASDVIRFMFWGIAQAGAWRVAQEAGWPQEV